MWAGLKGPEKGKRKTIGHGTGTKEYHHLEGRERGLRRPMIYPRERQKRRT